MMKDRGYVAVKLYSIRVEDPSIQMDMQEARLQMHAPLYHPFLDTPSNALVIVIHVQGNTQVSSSLISSIRCIFFSSSLIIPSELAL